MGGRKEDNCATPDLLDLANNHLESDRKTVKVRHSFYLIFALSVKIIEFLKVTLLERLNKANIRINLFRPDYHLGFVMRSNRG